MNTKLPLILFWIVACLILLSGPLYGITENPSQLQQVSEESSSLPWWSYPIFLFIVTCLIGILAVLAGVGGGVLFVPIVSSFFPFHLDFVRGTGLFVAMSLSLSAGPRLLNKGLANLRLAMPIALATSIGAIAGAITSFSLPTKTIQTALGATIISVSLLMLIFKKTDIPKKERPGYLSKILEIGGIYHEDTKSIHIEWNVHRLGRSLVLFIGIGFIAGMFGLGAGWANVPMLNLFLGLPLKMAVATSVFTISVTSTSASWIYLNQGAVLPIILVPSIAGIMIGSRIGAKILPKASPVAIRYIVIVVLALAGVRSLLKGVGI